jgi:hypothetical protein
MGTLLYDHPSYIKGRLGVIVINEFIADFNKALKQKYTALKEGRPKGQTKKNDQYYRWKREQEIGTYR